MVYFSKVSEVDKTFGKFVFSTQYAPNEARILEDGFNIASRAMYSLNSYCRPLLADFDTIQHFFATIWLRALCPSDGEGIGGTSKY